MSHFAEMILAAEKRLEHAIAVRKEKEEELEGIQERFEDSMMEWALACMAIGEEKLQREENEATLDEWRLPLHLWKYRCFWKGHDESDRAWKRAAGSGLLREINHGSKTWAAWQEVAFKNKWLGQKDQVLHLEELAWSAGSK